MFHVVPDSNVFISALVYGGKPLDLLEMGVEQEVTLLTSPAILEETLRVLQAKFSYTPEQLEGARHLIEAACYGVFKPGVEVKAVKEDPDDDKFLELAVQFADSVVATGDKHLLRLGKYEHVEIMTVAAFLERINRIVQR